MATTENKKEKVSITGPCSRGKCFRIHAAGCSDVKRDERTYGADASWTVEVTTRLGVVSNVYGPEAGSFYEEAGGDAACGSLESYLRGNLSDFHFAPCVKVLK